MKTKEASEDLKQIVREKYTSIVEEKNSTGCCDTTSCCSSMSDDYTKLEGYVSDADLHLGCGLPTEFAKINEGDTVIDLGSGAGNDAFVARAITGNEGRVIGIDFTPKMIEKAKENVSKLGYENVEFRFGDIEDIPVADNTADVVVSNCVLNLVPDKTKAFAEIFRVLKKGGHFSVSDIVLDGFLPHSLRTSAEMYAGCVSGAVQRNEYLDIIREAGFENISIQKNKTIMLPEDVLSKHLTAGEYEDYKKNNSGIFSITVYAEKPTNCCGPSCCS
jgi:arsenite methyltransferase